MSDTSTKIYCEHCNKNIAVRQCRDCGGVYCKKCMIKGDAACPFSFVTKEDEKLYKELPKEQLGGKDE